MGKNFIPKVKLRPQDYTKLGLKPLQEYACAYHFCHSESHLYNQVDYVSEHGHLAEGAI